MMWRSSDGHSRSRLLKFQGQAYRSKQESKVKSKLGPRTRYMSRSKTKSRDGVKQQSHDEHQLHD